MLKYIVIVLCGFSMISYSCGFDFWVFYMSGDAFAPRALPAMYCTFCKCTFEVLISSGDFSPVLSCSPWVSSLVASGSGPHML